MALFRLLRRSRTALPAAGFRCCASTTCATRSAREWVGHADVPTTMRYLHDVPRHDEAAFVARAFVPGFPCRRERRFAVIVTGGGVTLPIAAPFRSGRMMR
jgi:hypothetical protein